MGGPLAPVKGYLEMQGLFFPASMKHPAQAGDPKNIRKEGDGCPHTKLKTYPKWVATPSCSVKPPVVLLSSCTAPPLLGKFKPEVAALLAREGVQTRIGRIDNEFGVIDTSV